MNIKHSIIALGAAGATAALVFGGSAVSTAFTSNHAGSVAVNSATINDSYQNFTMWLDNALPSDSKSQTMSYTNNGSNPMSLVLKIGSIAATGNAGAIEGASRISVPGYGDFTLNQLPGARTGPCRSARLPRTRRGARTSR